MRPAEASNIYDLGYQHYLGVRLGRGHIIRSLYIESLRGAFGLGRGLPQKIFAFSLVGIAFVPALIMLAISALTTQKIDLWRYQDYYGLIQIVLALFAAGLGTEVVGRDQRNKLLPLYFSRSITRQDYAAAKLAALLTAMLVISIIPQVFLFVGNAFSTTDTFGYLQDEGDVIPAIVGAGMLISLVMATLGIAIAARTPRRAYATGATIAVFLVSTAVGNAVLHAAPDTFARFAILVSIFDVMDGFTLYFFSASTRGTSIGLADLPGIIYPLLALAVSFLAISLYFRRYERMSL